MCLVCTTLDRNVRIFCVYEYRYLKRYIYVQIGVCVNFVCASYALYVHDAYNSF